MGLKEAIDNQVTRNENAQSKLGNAKKQRFSLNLNAHLIHQLDEIVLQRKKHQPGYSRTELLEEIIKNYLDTEEE